MHKIIFSYWWARPACTVHVCDDRLSKDALTWPDALNYNLSIVKGQMAKKCSAVDELRGVATRHQALLLTKNAHTRVGIIIPTLMIRNTIFLIAYRKAHIKPTIRNVQNLLKIWKNEVEAHIKARAESWWSGRNIKSLMRVQASSTSNISLPSASRCRWPQIRSEGSSQETSHWVVTPAIHCSNWMSIWLWMFIGRLTSFSYLTGLVIIPLRLSSTMLSWLNLKFNSCDIWLWILIWLASSGHFDVSDFPDYRGVYITCVLSGITHTLVKHL